ncbi:hypothetical protein HPP92_011948 [Vanilla planifolia]|uniref:t-SNARE coiled-coil homology domain-containing protein n=1 Tax=Vanilla planifolia TaxID=51239 RepID=A0A835V1H9_VANPL|nr:hypothetical protein HPP92_011948 [Vanilla planifolia]
MSASRTPISNIYKRSQSESWLSGKDPLDSDLKLEQHRRSTRASSAPSIKSERKGCTSESGGFKDEVVQELEKYAVCEAEVTAKKINGCLKIAEEMRGDASRTIVNLHQQGEQITRTHLTAASIDEDLSRGEKLLGSLGGLFSKTWKPMKIREIKGPVVTRDDSLSRRNKHTEQRQRLGLNPQRPQSNPQRLPSEPSSALERVELEKAKQDDTLSDLGNLLGELKAMAIDMGSEIDWQNKALEHLEDDVDVLNTRVKAANHRARYLLRS